jgi:hypothetical protein
MNGVGQRPGDGRRVEQVNGRRQCWSLSRTYANAPRRIGKTAPGREKERPASLAVRRGTTACGWCAGCGAFLRDANEDDAFAAAGFQEPAQFFLHHVVLAFAFAETMQLHVFALEEVVDGREKGLGARHRGIGRGEAVPEITAAERCDASSLVSCGT